MEQGGLPQNALSIAARLNFKVEQSFARQSHFSPKRDPSVLLEADDPPEIERLAISEDIRMAAPTAQPRTTGESIQPATDDPERIGGMPATLAA